ncbi:hypothetical protein ACFWU5_16355 [Nocardia sp. NPDC058640]|uniref:hypothetical protein n=1 Tax=Nocardia sp. NPDC058640 TaxID=3346571 RepID=UPI00365D1B35
MSIETAYPEDRAGSSRWFHGRGRCDEHVWSFPLWGWTVKVYGRGKSYRKLTGLPKYSIDWIIDEFDASFNDLAVASLRYHMNFSVCWCSDEQRTTYMDLVARLTEPAPTFTTAEMGILNPPGWTFEDEFERPPNGNCRMRESTPEQKTIYAAFREREHAYNERIRQARHDFVDIIPELWS